MPSIDSLRPEVEALLRRTSEEIVLPRFHQLGDHERWEKSPGEIVTIVDREAEALLADGLRALLPRSRVIGEESAADNPLLLDSLDEGLVWLVDPLDGTANFVAGSPVFAIMAALFRDGEPVASWMLDPVGGAMAFSERGGGAFIGTERVSTDSHHVDLSDLRGAIHTGFLPRSLQTPILEAATRFRQVLPGMRCAGQEYPAIALGREHFAMFWRTLPWDHAPGALFISEAGGMAARLDGARFQPTRRAHGLLVAQTEGIWRTVRDCALSDVPVDVLRALTHDS